MNRNRCHSTLRTNKASTAAAAASDPFGPDGFGDSWDKSSCFGSDSDEEIYQQQSEFSSAEFDWTKSLTTIHREQAKAKRQEEERHRKQRDTDEELKAFRLKKKAAFEAAESAVAIEKAKVTAAKERWDRQVQSAEEHLLLAKPVQALEILYSLFADESFFHTIDEKEQGNIAQMSIALENHHELQKTLRVVPLIKHKESIESNESSNDESTCTTGGDTVKANHYSSDEDEDIFETANSTVVVDRSLF